MKNEAEAIEILRYEAQELRVAMKSYRSSQRDQQAKARADALMAAACASIAEHLERRAAELEAGATVATTPGHEPEA
jgi:hypothetical protein